MEADDNTPASLPPWVLLEYAHILERTFHPQQQNTVYFTNLSPASATSLMSTFDAQQSSSSASSAGSSIPPRSSYACVKESVDSLISAGVLPPKERVCLLDPRAEKTISPADSDEFDVFLFGGILGDDPPRDRTKELRKLGFPGRNLDTVQMTTDTAVYVTSLAVDHGSKWSLQAALLETSEALMFGHAEPIDKLPYVDYPTIEFNASESVEMPFRYVKDSQTGLPTMPKGMKELLERDMDKGFEDFEV